MSATAAVRERLSRWDTLAPLSERQKECFLELSSTAASRPLPEHVNWELRKLSNSFIKLCSTFQLPVEDMVCTDVSGSLPSQLDSIQTSQQVTLLNCTLFIVHSGISMY